MKKTKDSTKQKLEKNYNTAANDYLNELLRMWELDGYYGFWVSDEAGGVYCHGDWLYIGMENIIFCVKNDIEKEEYDEWTEYNVAAIDLGFNQISLTSWHRGCPRLSQYQINRLRQMQADLMKTTEQYNNNISVF